MSWAVAFAYVNNFNYTVQAPICAGYPQFRVDRTTGVEPSQFVGGDKLVLDTEYNWLFPPFSIMVFEDPKPQTQN